MAHYAISQIHSMADVRKFFPAGKADTMNWCVLSTSGVHGTYTTLDGLDVREPDDDEYDEISEPYITVLVIQPCLCALHYGHIIVGPEDRPWLRTLVASSLEAMAESQKRNMPLPPARCPECDGNYQHVNLVPSQEQGANMACPRCCCLFWRGPDGKLIHVENNETAP